MTASAPRLSVRARAARAASCGRRHWSQLLIAAVVTALLCLLIDRRPPIVVRGREMVPDRVQAGGDVELRIDVDVLRRDCDGTVTRSLISGTPGHPTQMYDSMPVVLPTKQAQRTFHVPRGFPRGPATYHSRISFVCNFMQNLWPIVVEPPDVSIYVEAASP